MDTERHETVRVVDNGDRSSTQQVVTKTSSKASPLGLARNIVSFIFGVLEVLLGLRFLLSIFGANRGNAFADFIYTTSGPFVAPFRGLFNTHTDFGTARFEYEVLVAMLVYVLLAWLIVWLLSLNRTDASE